MADRPFIWQKQWRAYNWTLGDATKAKKHRQVERRTFAPNVTEREDNISFDSVQVHRCRETSGWLVETDGWRSRSRLSPPCVTCPSNGLHVLSEGVSWTSRIDRRNIVSMRNNRKAYWRLVTLHWRIALLWRSNVLLGISTRRWHVAEGSPRHRLQPRKNFYFLRLTY